MTTVAVIPARYASSRFPGKPLARQTGKYLIQHVYERAKSCGKIDRVIVATDDGRIAQAVESFDGEVWQTRTDHLTGTDRVGEVVDGLELTDDDLVLNIQGDEPEIDVGVFERLIERMNDSQSPCRIGTLAARFDDEGPRKGAGSPLDPHCVKVVLDTEGRALYFSRSLIPHPRDTEGAIDKPSRWLLHLGVYAFRRDALRTITSGGVPRGELEQLESLEQLRWLEHGMSIGVVVVDHRFVGIDTPEDYEAFVVRDRSARTQMGCEAS
jgi:3-deoxy-manno-octulosonate cytidylyltransferase (CMP-KDO synthetase)